jgi:hypothetical protein
VQTWVLMYMVTRMTLYKYRARVQHLVRLLDDEAAVTSVIGLTVFSVLSTQYMTAEPVRFKIRSFQKEAWNLEAREDTVS